MTQNENGPCPLIRYFIVMYKLVFVVNNTFSIVNVLLLRGKMNLPEGCQVLM